MKLRAASLEEVPPGQPRLVEVNGSRVVLVRVGEQVYACGDTWAHKGGPLSEGKLSGSRLACPWHGWIYDVRTGQCAFPGRGASVPSYAVRVEANDVFVEMP
ncbi:MAG TPA: Rieske (2Fe-2S) protein [Methylomirabilota bacterium]|nr:Rieske (2Fe-2S) protein [Methylomirabilota bacterium]